MAQKMSMAARTGRDNQRKFVRDDSHPLDPLGTLRLLLP